MVCQGLVCATPESEDMLCTPSPNLPEVCLGAQRIPAASPEDLLTGDRDGSELAKVLVSPKSYDRTERMLRRKAAGQP